jgi:hypothetical protein
LLVLVSSHPLVLLGVKESSRNLTFLLFCSLASFEAVKAWEDHQRREGKTVNHSFAKELLAGFVGAEVDKL